MGEGEGKLKCVKLEVSVEQSLNVSDENCVGDVDRNAVRADSICNISRMFGIVRKSSLVY